jgi:hypothetical protein
MEAVYNIPVPQVFSNWAVAVTTASTQILGTGRNRVSLKFHNPGTVTVYVCPSKDALGNALTAVAAAAGMLQILPGDTQPVDAPGGLPWNGIAASTAVLTIMEYSGSSA